jgi:hypothetical protein
MFVLAVAKPSTPAASAMAKIVRARSATCAWWSGSVSRYVILTITADDNVRGRLVRLADAERDFLRRVGVRDYKWGHA